MTPLTNPINQSINQSINTSFPSLAGSNTMAISSFLALVLVLFVVKVNHRYVPSDEDVGLVNPDWVAKKWAAAHPAPQHADPDPEKAELRIFSGANGNGSEGTTGEGGDVLATKVNRLVQKVESLERQLRAGNSKVAAEA